jgi:HK97 family phage prohead protease
MIHTRTFTTEFLTRDDDRVISGTLVPYGVPTNVVEYGRRYTEDFAPGAFAADIARANEVELCALHPRSGAELPIGVTVSLTDTPTGLDGEWRISETSFGDEVLTLVRDKALRCLSAGFAEGRNRWHTRDRVTRLSATLDHASLVRRGAFPTARLRSTEAQSDALTLIARMRLR